MTIIVFYKRLLSDFLGRFENLDQPNINFFMLLTKTGFSDKRIHLLFTL